MNQRTRINQLETAFALEAAPLTKVEMMKWFVMFAERRGTGYATNVQEFSEEEWKWFEENGENFEKSLALVEKHRKKNYS